MYRRTDSTRWPASVTSRAPLTLEQRHTHSLGLGRPLDRSAIEYADQHGKASEA
jgi:hypothetical protein